jgi:hypothetical protein
MANLSALLHGYPQTLVASEERPDEVADALRRFLA